MVVNRISEPLLAAKISLSRLDAHVTGQKLDLFELVHKAAKCGRVPRRDGFGSFGSAGGSCDFLVCNFLWRCRVGRQGGKDEQGWLSATPPMLGAHQSE